MSEDSCEFSPWHIERKQYLASEDGYFESLFALSNCQIGLRATVDYDNGGGKPGFFLRNLYGPGLAVRSELVNAPNPCYWSLIVDGIPVNISACELQVFRQELDLRFATVTLNMRLRDACGKITDITVCNYLPWNTKNLCVTEISAKAINHNAPIHVYVGLDWRHGNGYLGGEDPTRVVHHLAVEDVSSDKNLCTLRAANRGTNQKICVTNLIAQPHEPVTSVNGGSTFFQLVPLESSKTLRVLSASSVGPNSEELPGENERVLDAALKQGTDGLRGEHIRICARRWKDYDVRITGNEEDQQAFRYGLFQLMQAPDRNLASHNIPARGLTSEYHSGHFFFNTELFLVPFYALVEPSVARSLVMFRLDSLPEARAHAKSTGFMGARYPEETAPDGMPASPLKIIDLFQSKIYTEYSGEQVMHISFDVLYALKRYEQETGDTTLPLLRRQSLLAEIARYAFELMRLDSDELSRGAHNVMCFDEFHYNVDNHYATNYLARWALLVAVKELRYVEEYDAETKPPTQTEIDAWISASQQISLPNKLGLMEQFSGYWNLPDQLIERATCGPTPMTNDDRRKMEELGTFSTQLVKQADIVLLVSLFLDDFSIEEIAKNFEYYEKRTAHASSLSEGPHSLVAARIGEWNSAIYYLRRAIRYNLDFVPRENYRNGVHLASYAAAWDALVRGFLGLHFDGDCLQISPELPPGWTKIALRLYCNENHLACVFRHNEVALSLVKKPIGQLDICVSGAYTTLGQHQNLIRFVRRPLGASCLPCWIAMNQRVERFIEKFSLSLEVLLGDLLLGVYVHGSIALGCFNPINSDIDVLVVVSSGLDESIRVRLADLSLKMSEIQPSNGDIEFSIIRHETALNPSYSMEYEFHYSSDWKERFMNGNVDFQQVNCDPDLPAHCAVTFARGVCAIGIPVSQAFAPVSWELYCGAILFDLESSLEDGRLESNPEDCLLNACRVLCMSESESQIVVSKVDGAKWACRELDTRFAKAIKIALSMYLGSEEGITEFSVLDKKHTKLLLRRAVKWLREVSKNYPTFSLS